MKGNGSWLLGPTPSTLVLERDYLYWNVKASGFRTTKLSVASNLEMTSVDMHGKDICVEVDVAKKEMVLFVNDEEKGIENYLVFFIFSNVFSFFFQGD